MSGVLDEDQHRGITDNKSHNDIKGSGTEDKKAGVTGVSQGNQSATPAEGDASGASPGSSTLLSARNSALLKETPPSSNDGALGPGMFLLGSGSTADDAELTSDSFLLSAAAVISSTYSSPGRKRIETNISITGFDTSKVENSDSNNDGDNGRDSVKGGGGVIPTKDQLSPHGLDNGISHSQCSSLLEGAATQGEGGPRAREAPRRYLCEADMHERAVWLEWVTGHKHVMALYGYSGLDYCIALQVILLAAATTLLPSGAASVAVNLDRAGRMPCKNQGNSPPQTISLHSSYAAPIISPVMCYLTSAAGGLLDLSSLCWSHSPIPAQLVSNLSSFALLALRLNDRRCPIIDEHSIDSGDRPQIVIAASAAPQLLEPTPDRFVFHVIVQDWLWRLWEAVQEERAARYEHLAKGEGAKRQPGDRGENVYAKAYNIPICGSDLIQRWDTGAMVASLRRRYGFAAGNVFVDAPLAKALYASYRSMLPSLNQQPLPAPKPPSPPPESSGTPLPKRPPTVSPVRRGGPPAATPSGSGPYPSRAALPGRKRPAGDNAATDLETKKRRQTMMTELRAPIVLPRPPFLASVLGIPLAEGHQATGRTVGTPPASGRSSSVSSIGSRQRVHPPTTPPAPHGQPKNNGPSDRGAQQAHPTVIGAKGETAGRRPPPLSEMVDQYASLVVECSALRAQLLEAMAIIAAPPPSVPPRDLAGLALWDLPAPADANASASPPRYHYNNVEPCYADVEAALTAPLKKDVCPEALSLQR